MLCQGDPRSHAFRAALTAAYVFLSAHRIFVAHQLVCGQAVDRYTARECYYLLLLSIGLRRLASYPLTIDVLGCERISRMPRVRMGQSLYLIVHKGLCEMRIKLLGKLFGILGI